MGRIWGLELGGLGECQYVKVWGSVLVCVCVCCVCVTCEEMCNLKLVIGPHRQSSACFWLQSAFVRMPPAGIFPAQLEGDRGAEQVFFITSVRDHLSLSGLCP